MRYLNSYASTEWYTRTMKENGYKSIEEIDKVYKIEILGC